MLVDFLGSAKFQWSLDAKDGQDEITHTLRYIDQTYL
jgi:hypothetical protein